MTPGSIVLKKEPHLGLALLTALTSPVSLAPPGSLGQQLSFLLSCVWWLYSVWFGYWFSEPHLGLSFLFVFPLADQTKLFFLHKKLKHPRQKAREWTPFPVCAGTPVVCSKHLTTQNRVLRGVCMLQAFFFLGAEGAQRLAASNFYFVDGEIWSSHGNVILGYLTNQSASTFMNSAMPAAKDHHSLLTTDGRGGRVMGSSLKYPANSPNQL